MYIFEISWEVCNKVGGIHTVLTTKAAEAVEAYGENYMAIGPLRLVNEGFSQTQEEWIEHLQPALTKLGIRCKLGRWDIPGFPRVLLVDFERMLADETLLFSLWKEFGVDSYQSTHDYIEPVAFAAACADAIIGMLTAMDLPPSEAVVHAHEWMAGAAILRCRAKAPEIASVFTTHATMLGRTLATQGYSADHYRDFHDTMAAAQERGIRHKHSMETVCAQLSDVFTTVSEPTGDEARTLLGKGPTLITPNGLDLDSIPNYADDRKKARDLRKKILGPVRRMLGKNLPEDSFLIVTSGRYEFGNKGYGLLLKALDILEGQGEQSLRTAKPVVLLALIAAGHFPLLPEIHEKLQDKLPTPAKGPAPVLTHAIDLQETDPFLRACREHKLLNGGHNLVHIVFCPVYLDGHDGFFDLPYYDVLAACDLAVFPSFYEPWGYTPQEALAFAVPTITTDCAGFGAFAAPFAAETGQALTILKRKGLTESETAEDCAQTIASHMALDDEQRQSLRRKARYLVQRTQWSSFYAAYKKAYDLACSTAKHRKTNPGAAA